MGQGLEASLEYCEVERIVAHAAQNAGPIVHRPYFSSSTHLSLRFSAEALFVFAVCIFIVLAFAVVRNGVWYSGKIFVVAGMPLVYPSAKKT